MSNEVIIDMKNENALYTVSMLSALLESGSGNYLDLLTPFVLYSLPSIANAEISIEQITESMREFGFQDFPRKTTEKILDHLCKGTDQGVVHVTCDKRNKKKQYTVATIYNRTDFDDSKYEMRRKIDEILKAIQEYFETHFYFRKVGLDEIKEKLIAFFESNGLTVIHSISDLRLLQKENGSDCFEIAHFVLEQHEKKTLIFDDLCEVTKGFLTYKAIYYFADERKNSMDSKLKDVTFYLDCSLVLDALGYDNPEDERAIKELIRLIRRNGGHVAVFEHTIEEAARLIEAFANKPYCKNNFRLDSLASKNLSREILLGLSKQLDKILKENTSIDVVETPSFADQSNYINILGEEEIIDWLKANRPKSKGSTYSEDERYQFDARSIIAVGMLRRGNRSQYIEHAKAIIVTQDSWLNRCLRDLCGERFKTEVAFAISDTDLVSLLWMRDYKQTSSLPSDILIANAHAACRVTPEVMDRAIQIADTMAASGTLLPDAALMVSAHTDFKPFLAERVRNNAAMLSENEIRDAVTAYISKQSREQVAAVRDEERVNAEEKLSRQKDAHSQISAEYEAELQSRDNTIKALRQEILIKEENSKQDKIHRAEKHAHKLSQTAFYMMIGLLFALDMAIVLVFGIHCWNEYCSQNAWLPYLIVEVLGFTGVPALILSKSSPLYKAICWSRDRIYSKAYSFFLDN